MQNWTFQDFLTSIFCVRVYMRCVLVRHSSSMRILMYIVICLHLKYFIIFFLSLFIYYFAFCYYVCFYYQFDSSYAKYIIQLYGAMYILQNFTRANEWVNGHGFDCYLSLCVSNQNVFLCVWWDLERSLIYMYIS